MRYLWSVLVVAALLAGCAQPVPRGMLLQAGRAAALKEGKPQGHVPYAVVEVSTAGTYRVAFAWPEGSKLPESGANFITKGPERRQITGTVVPEGDAEPMVTLYHVRGDGTLRVLAEAKGTR